MGEEQAVLSEKLEDLIKAAEWGRKQQEKMRNEKEERLADALMEKITPLILQRNSTK